MGATITRKFALLGRAFHHATLKGVSKRAPDAPTGSTSCVSPLTGAKSA
jgi:hypothetical protein